MQGTIRLERSGALLALLMLSTLTTGCIVEPRNDYYDRDHHRYYYGHAWHDCGERDDHCR